MTSFIVICALLAAVAVVLLAWPLLRPTAGDPQASPRAGVAAAMVAALLPLSAFATYFWASNWSWDPAKQAVADSAPGLEQMIAQLQERLSQQPDDLEGWKLLGRSATVINNFAIAREAFSKAFTLSKGQDPDAVVGYAESLVLNDEREIDGQAAKLFEQALSMDPDNARALWYGGITAYRRGDLTLAQQRWVELQNHDLPPDLRQVVAERLAEIEKAQGKPPESTRTFAQESGTGEIAVSIGVAPALAARASPSAMLFVIARRGDAGPPLAVVRRAIGSWPVSVTLTDADAMLPGVKLSAGGPLKIVARISQSGQPVAASGDLFGEVGYDFISARPASITIDRIVP